MPGFENIPIDPEGLRPEWATIKMTDEASLPPKDEMTALEKGAFMAGGASVERYRYYDDPALQVAFLQGALARAKMRLQSQQ